MIRIIKPDDAADAIAIAVCHARLTLDKESILCQNVQKSNVPGCYKPQTEFQ